MTAIDNIINQIEGETQNRGNTKTRIAAVLRLLRDKIERLFSTKLDKGNYTGTADDLRTSIDRKVDKVPGKMLSTNDFTNELRTKLEGLRNVDISQLLPKGSYTGTAQNLKELIDNIMRILQSPDTELDELREIVAYIKQNKRTLDTLGISNIAGLQDALRGKAPTDHHHDDRYSRLGHTHSEYALRTHRHRWDDIDGKPSLNYLPLVGGTLTGNVVLNQGVFKKGSPISGYIVDCFAANNNINSKTNPIYVIGEEYKPTDAALANMYGIGYTTSKAEFINGEDLGFTAVKAIQGWGLYIAAFGKVRHFLDANTGNSYQFGDSRANGFIKKNSSNDYILLGGGGHKKLSDIEPTNISASNNIICNHSHNNSVIFVENNLAIQLKDLAHLDCVSFRKVYAGGGVTFSCTGKTIIYTGDNAFNGGDGSTAVVSIWNQKCYIDIRNV